MFIEHEVLRYVCWIREREKIRVLKESGAPRPWTNDPVLLNFRFCNVRRMDDKVSRKLVSGWYPKFTEDQILPAAVMARFINWPESLFEAAPAARFDLSELPAFRERLKQRAARGEKSWTGAYIVPPTPGFSKVDSVLDLVEQVHVLRHKIMRGTMKETWLALMELRGMGSFLAGQVVADIAELSSGREWPDRLTWAPLGPGSKRGLNRLLGRRTENVMHQPEFETLLPELIRVIRPQIEPICADRGLIAMDWQNTLCESDKNRRCQLSEGSMRARYAGSAVAATLFD